MFDETHQWNHLALEFLGGKIVNYNINFFCKYRALLGFNFVSVWIICISQGTCQFHLMYWVCGHSIYASLLLCIHHLCSIATDACSFICDVDQLCFLLFFHDSSGLKLIDFFNERTFSFVGIFCYLFLVLHWSPLNLYHSYGFVII